MTRGTQSGGLIDRTFQVKLCGRLSRELDFMASRMDCAPDVVAEALLLLGLRQCDSQATLQFLGTYCSNAKALHSSRGRQTEGG